MGAAGRPAVAIAGLSWTYERRSEPALRDVDLTIDQGEFLGVVGPNESGKSTLLYVIQGLIPSNFNGIWRGRVELFGKDTSAMSGLERAAAAGLVFADPEAQFTAMTVEEELVFGLENLGLDHRQIELRLQRVSDLIDLEELYDRSPYDLSGGQKQRVAIACVLAMEPRVLLLDEPTSMIDPRGKKEIFEVLRRLKDTDHTVVVVEHNLEELAALADRVCLVEGGRVRPPLPAGEFFARVDELIEAGLQPPQVAQTFAELARAGLYDGPPPYRFEPAVSAAREVLSHG